MDWGLLVGSATLAVAVATLWVMVGFELRRRRQSAPMVSVSTVGRVGEPVDGWEARPIDVTVNALAPITVVHWALRGVTVWTQEHSESGNLGKLPSVLAPAVSYRVIAESDDWRNAWIFLLIVDHREQVAAAEWHALDDDTELRSAPRTWAGRVRRLLPLAWRPVQPVGPGAQWRQVWRPKRTSVELIDRVKQVVAQSEGRGSPSLRTLNRP